MTRKDFLSVVQVPSDDGDTSSSSNGFFISLIDASGSMQPYWKAVANLYNEYAPKTSVHTITFSGQPSICVSNILDQRLDKHGGGMTNIPAAFTALDVKLSELDSSTPITVLFVSDGQDNNISSLNQRLKQLKGHQGKKITFLCLGIQSGFPTFLSMTLRELYHNTVSSIPALFLIEYFTEAALRNKFEAMKEFFQQRKKIKVSPPVREFPWSFEESDEHYEGSWIVLSSDSFPGDTFTIGGKEFYLPDHPPTIDTVLDVFRAYVQEMQMLSLQKSECLQEQAGEALRIMRLLLDHFSATKGVDLLKQFKMIGTMDSEEVTEEVDQLMKLDFKQRVDFNKLRHNQFRVQGYFENIEMLAKGLGVQALNEWEAAKRIGIGTITGNYHQRALNLRGLTVENFKIMRNEFLELYKAANFSRQRSEQEESVVTLVNQKDVFLDPEFAKGLIGCASQFDLVETFPVVGLALKVRRPQGIDMDPWLISVQSIAKHNRQMDSFSLLKSDFCMSLSSGQGQTEVINAVLPLFTLNDADLSPLISHNLFNLLMTFVVQRNVDTLDPNAYLALLGNTWLHLLTTAQSEYRDRLMSSIHETIQLVYGANADCNSLKSQLMNPKTLLTPNPTTSQLLKPIIFTLVLHFSKNLEPSTASRLLDVLLIQFIISTKIGWQPLIQVEDDGLASVSAEIIAQCEREFKTVFTLGDLNTRFKKNYQSRSTNFFETSTLDISVKRIKLEFPGEKISLPLFISLYELILGQAPSDQHLLKLIYLSSKPINEIASGLDSIKNEDAANFIKQHLKKNPGELLIALENDASTEVKLRFTKYFQNNHSTVMPLSALTILDYCQKKKIDPHNLEYDTTSNMVRNACMAINCPYFLNPTKNLNKHLHTWQEKCPRAFHKLVRNNQTIPNEDLVKMLESGSAQINPKIEQPLEKMVPSDKSFALDYIEKVKKEYEKIANQGTPSDLPFRKFEASHAGARNKKANPKKKGNYRRHNKKK
eukprot:TRINITY_DN17503_c0_g1_i1.p1 TRINITY_DN17503_c0_g1~~TRINITY_DN17503_c0_g1_i1.p1  ORF type:complete len:991 (+),score=218.00 TRINITY_DN17503_c0_g1_i1:42-3014(+)